MRTTRPGLKPSEPALSRAGLASDASGSRDDDGADPVFIQSLARGLAIIEAFGQAGTGLTLAEAARRTGISRASARRSLHTLEALGYASTDGHRFTLTPRILRLGFSYLRSGDLWSVAQAPMLDVVEATHESCSAAVLDGTEIVYVARVPTRARVMSVTLGVGSRLPAASTSMGRVLLAHLAPAERERTLSLAGLLPAHTGLTITDRAALERELDRVADQGYSLVDQELEPGLRSIAVPVRDAGDRVIAALNVGTHAGRVTIERLRDDILPALQHCADRIREALGGRPCS